MTSSGIPWDWTRHFHPRTHTITPVKFPKEWVKLTIEKSNLEYSRKGNLGRSDKENETYIYTSISNKISKSSSSYWILTTRIPNVTARIHKFSARIPQADEILKSDITGISSNVLSVRCNLNASHGAMMMKVWSSKNINKFVTKQVPKMNQIYNQETTICLFYHPTNFRQLQRASNKVILQKFKVHESSWLPCPQC